MKKLICKLFGHKWTKKIHGRLCSRCRIFEAISMFDTSKGVLQFSDEFNLLLKGEIKKTDYFLKKINDISDK